MQDVKNLSTVEVLHKLPVDIGSVKGFSGDIRHTEFYKFSSQVSPGTIYHLDLSTGKPVVCPEGSRQYRGKYY